MRAIKKVGERPAAHIGTGEVRRCPDECLFVSCYPEITRCEVCGLGKTVASGKPAQAQDYRNLTAEGRATKTRYFRALHRRFLKTLPPGALLDVGCSDGLMLDVMAMLGWRVLGTDAFDNPDARPDIVMGDFLHADLSGPFDLITLIHSFEHMADPTATLDRCAQLLRPGGHLFIAVPNFSSEWSKATGVNWPWLNVNDHRFHYTAETLNRLLPQHGFKVLLLKTYSGFAPSIPQVYLSEQRVFEHLLLRWRPLRSMVFRLSAMMRIPGGLLADILDCGAEIQILARFG